MEAFVWVVGGLCTSCMCVLLHCLAVAAAYTLVTGYWLLCTAHTGLPILVKGLRQLARHVTPLPSLLAPPLIFFSFSFFFLTL
jgi:hypothetical protein